MAITRLSDRRVYNFKSTGVSFEQQVDLDKRVLAPPPVGIKTPISLADYGENFLTMNTTFADQIHDNLINLILTNHGERLALPDFGANLMELAFEMQEETGQTKAMQRINKAVGKYMPYIHLMSFEPLVDHFDNKEVAKVGVKLSYRVPRIGAPERKMEVLIYSAG